MSFTSDNAYKMIVDEEKETRSAEQNRKMWAMLGEIAEQLQINGQSFDKDRWKAIMLHAWGEQVRRLRTPGEPGTDGMTTTSATTHGGVDDDAVVRAAVLGFIVFVIWELTEDYPIVDLRVFRHRGFAVSAVAMSFTFGAFFASIVLLPLWLQINLGYTATLSGYVLSFQAIFGVIMAPVAAILMTRVDPRALMSLGLAILSLAILYRASFALNISFETMILPQLAMGLGIPLFFVPLMTLSMTAVRPQETAAASGLINFLRTISGAIATAAVISAWSSYAAISRSNLVGTLRHSQDFLDRLGDKGQPANRALGTLNGLVQDQSVMLATNHMFLLLGAVIGLTAIGIWLMPKPSMT